MVSWCAGMRAKKQHVRESVILKRFEKSAFFARFVGSFVEHKRNTSKLFAHVFGARTYLLHIVFGLRTQNTRL